MKHYSNPHQNIRSVSVAATQVLNDYKKKLEDSVEEVRKDYERQLIEKGNDDWLRCLAVSGLIYREQTGSNKKTEKFLSRLAEVLQQTKEDGITTAELVAELSRITDIELKVEVNKNE